MTPLVWANFPLVPLFLLARLAWAGLRLARRAAGRASPASASKSGGGLSASTHVRTARTSSSSTAEAYG
jgi:hypothetical protein